MTTHTADSGSVGKQLTSMDEHKTEDAVFDDLMKELDIQQQIESKAANESKEQDTQPSSPTSTLPPADATVTIDQQSVKSYDSGITFIKQLHGRDEDDEKQPFKFKYQARTLITNMRKQLVQLQPQVDAEDSYALRKVKEWLTILDYWLGMNYCLTEEWQLGERLLSATLPQLTAVDSQHYRYTCEILDGYNQLAIVWSNRAEYMKAYENLVVAQKLYYEVRDSRESLTGSNESKVEEPIKDTATDKTIRNDDEMYNLLHANHTLTLFYLAQTLQQLREDQMSALYCSITLNRQLLANAGQFDAVRLEWCRNAMELNAFYCNIHQYDAAYQCLAAAQQQAEVKHKLYPLSVLGRNDEPTRVHLFAADLARKWGDYYLHWLKWSSKQHLLQQHATDPTSQPAEAGSDDDDDEKPSDDPLLKLLNKKQLLSAEQWTEAQRLRKVAEQQNLQLTASNASLSTPTPKQQHKQLFPTLTLPSPKANTPDSPLVDFTAATTYTGARDLFLQALNWYQQALRIYGLDGYVSDHIPIQQDISALYRLLAVYETDRTRQIKMHKRRVDLLDPIQRVLNSHFFLELYQQLCHEIAQIHTEIYELKAQEAPTQYSDAHQQKLNSSLLAAISNYQKWLETWLKDRKPPETLDETYQQSYISVLFYVARLYSKLYTTDRKALVSSLQQSLAAYTEVTDTIARFKVEKEYPSELDAAEQMMQLLPHKMARVMAVGAFRE